MKNNLLSYMLVILLLSCKNIVQHSNSPEEMKKESFPVTIKVDEARSNHEIPLLSSFSDDVNYIKLKTPSNIIIKEIWDVQILKGNFFILEGLSETVMVFDKAGNFIKQIGNRGRGPDEYIYLRSFCIDQNNEDLLFYTSPSGILRYSSNGKVIGKLFKFPYADNMYSVGKILVFTGFLTFETRNMPDDLTQFATTNQLGQKIDSVAIPFYSISNWRKKGAYFPGNHQSTNFNKSLLLNGSGEDTVFQITQYGKIQPRYVQDFGKFSNPVETRYIPHSQVNLNNCIMAISPIFETVNNVWRKYAFKNEAFLMRYDKTKQEAFTFFYKGEKEIDFTKGKKSLDELGIVNDIDGGLDFFPKWSVYNDTTQFFVSAIEALDFKKELSPEHFKSKDLKFSDKKEELKNFTDNLTEKDDFVLTVVRLK
jgi:hypothetical protein